MVKSVLEVDVRRASLRRSRRRVYWWRDEFGREWQSRDVSVGGDVMDDTRCSDERRLRDEVTRGKKFLKACLIDHGFR